MKKSLLLSLILIASNALMGCNVVDNSSSYENSPSPSYTDLSYNTVYYDDIEAMLNEPQNKDFLLIYGSSLCSPCQSFLDTTINRFLESSNNIEINYFDYNHAIDIGISDLSLALQRQDLLNNLDLNYYSAEAVNYENLATPTLYFFVNGTPYRIHVGALSYSQFINFINKNIVFTY